MKSKIFSSITCLTILLLLAEAFLWIYGIYDYKKSKNTTTILFDYIQPLFIFFLSAGTMLTLLNIICIFYGRKNLWFHIAFSVIIAFVPIISIAILLRHP